MQIQTSKSRIHRVIPDSNGGEVYGCTKDAAETVNQFKVFHDGSKAVAANFGIEGFDDDLNVFASKRMVELMVLEALEGHDGRDLSICDKLATEVEQGAEIGQRKIVGLVWVCLFGSCVGNVARWRATGHQGVA